VRVTRTADVLVVGAGPTGLVLALWLSRLGAGVRIVDKTPEPGTTSRAIAVQARTLELYGHFGIAEDVVARGVRAEAANLWVRERRRARARLGDIGAGLSPFPFALIFPQDEHERLLIARLAEHGVAVERETELARCAETKDGVRAVLRRGGREEAVDVQYIAGCDGVHSTVRQALGIDFPGGIYEHLFYVADVEGRGQPMNGEINVSLEPNDFLVVFPMKGEGHARLIGTVRGDGGAHADLTWDDVNKAPIERMHIGVDRVNWFSTYHVHHRVAESFRSGRAFLAGDAAHVHSPVGGQGMNTGIGDAVNLAWKLAAVVRRRAPARLLDSYEPERIAFARRLVATTDQAFTAVTSSSALARLVRMDIVPALLPAAFSFAPIRRLMFRTVSQTAINYRGSALSAGRAGSVRGGDRLPWVRTESGDNFAPLRSIDWQVHVYGEAAASLRTLCRARTLTLSVFPWSAEARRAGLARDAMYLVRPDGYVALADRDGSGAGLAAYLDARGLGASAGSK
jgi:2-polyprenyl-6-methoxyphenol hydroxylase-like FAD-dependent oxidoreductase